MTASLTRRRKILYFLLLFSLLYASIELLAWAGYRLAFPGGGSPRDLAAEREALRKGTPSPDTEEVLSPGEVAGRSVPYLMHPYYGFAAIDRTGQGRARRRRSVNRLGFLSASPAVLRRAQDRVVVAVAGGSVAYYGATWGRDTLATGLGAGPRLAGKQIVVTTYALGAYKQPQHLMVINDILTRGGQIDVLILIDGFNEAVLGININRMHGVDPFLPHYWFMLAKDMPPIANVRTIGRIEHLKSERQRRAHTFSRLGARYSMLASLIWKTLDARSAHAIASARQDLVMPPAGGSAIAEKLEANDRAWFGSVPEYESVRDFYIEAAASWATASLILDRLIEAQGGRFFHFLQPNQYFPGAKRLTREERDLLLPDSHPQHWNLATGYPYFRAAGEEARRAGVTFHDLTYLYEDTTETVYRDSCCHVNRLGNDILMTRVGEAVLAGLAAGNDQVQSGLGGGHAFPDLRDGAVFSIENLRRFAPRNVPYDDGRKRPWGLGTSEGAG